MNFTYYTHSCFELNSPDFRILVDPFIQSAGQGNSIDTTNIQANFILLSHGHFDHIADVEQYIANQPTIVCSFEISQWLNKKGIKHTHGMNLGGTFKGNGFSAKMVHAAHSSTLPDGSNGGPAAGFIIETHGLRLYYTGDTSLHADMELIGKYFRPDWIILPMGGTYTMDVNDALIACELTQCSNAIGVHFDTFDAIKINHEDAHMRFQQKNIQLILPVSGQTIQLNEWEK